MNIPTKNPLLKGIFKVFDGTFHLIFLLEPKRAKDKDSVRHVTILSFLVWGSPLAIGAILFMLGQPSGWKYSLIVVGVWIGFALVMERVIEHTAGLMPTLVGGGSGHYKRDFSEQDAMIKRGEPMEAKRSYQAILRAEPDDWEARVKLALLYEDQFHDLTNALYQWTLVSRLKVEVPVELRIQAFHRRLDILEIKDPDPHLATLVHEEIIKTFPNTPMSRNSERRMEELRPRPKQSSAASKKE